MPGSDAMALALQRAIRAERGRLALSQVALVERLGGDWSRQMIAAIEVGTRKVWAHELPDLCRALDVELADLLVRAPAQDRSALGV